MSGTGEAYLGGGGEHLEEVRDSDESDNNAGREVEEEDRGREEEEGEEAGVAGHESKWGETYRRLVGYQAEHGDCLVPYRYVPDPKLGRWVSIQRSHYRKLQEDGLRTSANLNAERIAKLDALGFEWSRKESRHMPWDVRYSELVQYYNQYGNSQVPMGWPDNPQLATWVSTQRQEYKFLLQGRDSRLTPDRMQRLEAVRFVWDARKSAPGNSNSWDANAIARDGITHSPSKRSRSSEYPSTTNASPGGGEKMPARPDPSSVVPSAPSVLPLQQSLLPPPYVVPSFVQQPLPSLPTSPGFAVPATFAAPPTQTYVGLRAFPSAPLQAPRLLSATVPTLPPGGSATIRFVPHPGPAATLGGVGPYLLADGVGASGVLLRPPPPPPPTAAYSALDPTVQAFLRGRSAALEAAATQQNQFQLLQQQQNHFQFQQQQPHPHYQLQQLQHPQYQLQQLQQQNQLQQHLLQQHQLQQQHQLHQLQQQHQLQQHQQQHQLQQHQLQQHQHQQHQMHRQQQQLQLHQAGAAASLQHEVQPAGADDGSQNARGDDHRRTSVESSPASSDGRRGGGTAAATLSSSQKRTPATPAKPKNDSKIRMDSIIPVETSARITASGYRLALVPLSAMEGDADIGGGEEEEEEASKAAAAARLAKRSSTASSNKRRHKRRSSSKSKRKRSKRRKYDSSSESSSPSSRSHSSSDDSSHEEDNQQGGSSSSRRSRSASRSSTSPRGEEADGGGHRDANKGDSGASSRKRRHHGKHAR